MKWPECVKTELTCLRGARKAILSALWLVEPNLTFPFNKVWSKYSVYWRLFWVVCCDLMALYFEPFVSHIVEFISWTGKYILVMNFICTCSSTCLTKTVPLLLHSQLALLCTTTLEWPCGHELLLIFFFQVHEQSWIHIAVNGELSDLALHAVSAAAVKKCYSKSSNEWIFAESLLIKKGCFGI